jgi:ureidoacrylate peracid hydrolase
MERVVGHASAIRITGRYWRWFPPEKPLGPAEEVLDLPIEETVFLLVDVYGGVDEDGDAPQPKTPDVYSPTSGASFRDIVRRRIVPAKAAAKRAGLRVVYVANHLSAGLSAGSEWRNVTLRTWGADVLETWRPPARFLEHAAIIAPGPDEPVIQKQMYSGFFGTNLDAVLGGHGARNLVVVGFESLICIGMTVTEAMYRDYRVIVLRDAIRTTEFPETEKGEWANFLAVRLIEANVGYTSTTDDFIAACDAIVGDGGSSQRQS